MRKEYGRALRDMFEERMRTELPAWASVKPPSPWYWPGERVFVLPRDGGVTTVIVLQPSLKEHDTFDVQLGWSRWGRPPELTMRPCLAAPRSAEAREADEYVCRLGDLLPGPRSGHDRTVGWVVDPRTLSVDFADLTAAMEERQQRLGAADARARVAPLLDDAWDALRTHGLPYLDESLHTVQQQGRCA